MATSGKGVLDKWGKQDENDGDRSPDQVNRDRLDSIGNEQRVYSIDSPDGIAETEEGDQLKLGGELATLFKDNKVHPVFIFGSKGSGKTSLLASLFRYVQLSANAEATIQLFDDLLPANDERWRKHTSWARDVFYKKVNDSIESSAPGATLEPSPFFVPIKLKRKTGEEISFAFLEGKGEWYMPDETSEVPVKPFKGLLQGVLQQFNGPSTVIYVAPFTTGEYARGGSTEGSRSTDLRKSDRGLVGAISEYVGLRRAHFHQDSHLFLMSKWDIFCGGVASEAFYNPPASEIQRLFGERFELAWTRFQNLEASGIGQNKTFSAYCAGVIDGQSILRPAVEDAEVIDRYPRKIWDWLHKSHTGLPLYADMQPNRQSLLDKFVHMLRG